MLKPVLGRLVAGDHLGAEEMEGAMRLLMAGELPDAQIAAFLTALRMKGERAEELVGAARVMRALATPVRAPEGAIDLCGTGGDATGTFNISTTAAFVAAGAGALVAKHGNHSFSSASGSADVLAALGLRLDLPPDRVEAALAELGVAFLYAPALHGAMRHAAGVRRALGYRTLFNLLGPLSNPAGARRQLLGVYDRALIPVLLPALRELGAVAAMVVHGADGLDELSLSGPSWVGELRGGVMRHHEVRPEEVGLTAAPLEALRGGDPAANAAIARAVLEGERGAPRDVVLLNAAAALVVAGLAPDLREGVGLAAASIDSGRALGKLEALVAHSRAEGPTPPSRESEPAAPSRESDPAAPDRAEGSARP